MLMFRVSAINLIVSSVRFSDLLTGIKGIINTPITLKGDGAEDFFQLKDIYKVRPVSPCQDRPPQVNKDVLDEVKNIEVVVGRLYEKELPTELIIDKVWHQYLLV